MRPGNLYAGETGLGRSLGELVHAKMALVAICRRCKHRRVLFPANYIARFGHEYPAIELRKHLRCTECRGRGKPARVGALVCRGPRPCTSTVYKPSQTNGAMASYLRSVPSRRIRFNLASNNPCTTCSPEISQSRQLCGQPIAAAPATGSSWPRRLGSRKRSTPSRGMTAVGRSQIRDTRISISAAHRRLRVIPTASFTGAWHFNHQGRAISSPRPFHPTVKPRSLPGRGRAQMLKPPPFRGCTIASPRPIDGQCHWSERHEQDAEDDAVQHANRAHAVTLENDSWAWTVIFTTTALTALSVVALFTIATG